MSTLLLKKSPTHVGQLHLFTSLPIILLPSGHKVIQWALLFLFHSFIQTDFILDGSVLQEFYKITSNLTPDEKAAALEVNQDFHKAHESLSREGQTAAPNPDDKVDLHFIALVHINGNLYELGIGGNWKFSSTLSQSKRISDGRKPFPIPHGKTTGETLMEDAAAIIKAKFIEKNPDNLRFTVMALAKTD